MGYKVSAIKSELKTGFVFTSTNWEFKRFSSLMEGKRLFLKCKVPFCKRLNSWEKIEVRELGRSVQLV